MLHLRSQINEGSSTARLKFYNPNPSELNRKIKLIDLLAKSEDDPDLIKIKVVGDGGFTQNRTIKELFKRERTKEKSIKDLAKVFTTITYEMRTKYGQLLSHPFTIRHSARTALVSILLPPRGSIYTSHRGFFTMIGFHPDQIVTSQRKKSSVFGLFNPHDQPIVIVSEEPVPFEAPLADLPEIMLETMTPEDANELRRLSPDGTFTLTFEWNADANAYIERKLEKITDATTLSRELIPLFRKLEDQLGLSNGILKVGEKNGQILLYTTPPVANYNLIYTVYFNRTLARLMNSDTEYVFDLNASPDREGRQSIFHLGPVTPLSENNLERYYPLVIKVNSTHANSYISGQGTTAELAYIDNDGIITHSNDFPIDDYMTVLEIQFLRRDLSELKFQENLTLIAHFKFT